MLPLSEFLIGWVDADVCMVFGVLKNGLLGLTICKDIQICKNAMSFADVKN